MSYILAALEKADKERKKKRGLSFDNVSETSPESGMESVRRSKSAVLLSGGLGLLIAVALIWHLTTDQPQVEFSAAEQPARTSTALGSVATPSDTEGGNPRMDELPGQLEVEGIVFVEGQPSRSRVFIDGRGYKAGDIYQASLRILTISETEITLSSGETSRTYPIP